MTPLIRRISHLLDPLAEFYSADGRAMPGIRVLAAMDLPQPYRDLLSHDKDMTSTLELHYGESIHLRVMNVHPQGTLLNRQVVLETDHTSRPVEFGAIQIHLERFSDAAREDILACQRPLGTILATHKVAYVSNPSAYFAIQPDEITRGAFHMAADSSLIERAEPVEVNSQLSESGGHNDDNAALYGRHNLLSTPDGQTLAEVVEILAPT